MNERLSDRKFRHEYKFFISKSEYYALKTRLGAVMKPDPNAGESGSYKIRSLYFDNVYDTCLKEKLYGVNNREKFRIRIYNGDSSFIRLEKKSKLNGLCSKISAPLTAEQTMRVMNGDIGWMKKSGHALITELYSKMQSKILRPCVIVEYMREPFIYRPGNVRITLDSNVSTGLKITDILRTDIPRVPVRDSAVLLEVKYDEFLPSVIRDIIQLGSCTRESFSKYGACRMYG